VNFRTLTTVLLALTCACVLLACGRDSLPPLLTVTSVGPAHIEVGERLEIRGAGFPAGRPANIVFRGSIAKPGEDLDKNAEIHLRGTAVSESSIEVELDEEASVSFARSARHATFQGEVEVAFSSTEGAPVYGVLGGTLLDIRNVRVDDDEASTAAGLAFLKGHGVTIDASPMGIRVSEIDPGSAAEVSGIAPGDRLLAYGPLQVLEASDFARGSSSPFVDMLVRRSASGAEEHVRLELRMDALRPANTVVWGGTFVLFLAVMVSLLLAHPSPRLLSFARLLKARGAASWTTLLPEKAQLALTFGVLTLFAIVPISRYWLVRDLDCSIAGSMLLGTHFWLLCHTEREGARGVRQLGSRLRTWFTAVLLSLPALVLLVGVFFALGSLRLEDTMRFQGALPWQWSMLTDPARFGVFALFACVFVQKQRAFASGAPGQGLVRTLATLRLSLTAALLTLLFLGGWRVPAVLDSVQSNRVFLVSAAFVFLLKSASMVMLLRWLERLLPAIEPKLAVQSVFRAQLPGTLALLAATIALELLRPGERVALSLRVLTVGVLLLVCVRIASALRDMRRTPIS
jgi:NADH:ubiquinone oxidoreductase subunit H